MGAMSVKVTHIDTDGKVWGAKTEIILTARIRAGLAALVVGS